MARLRKFLREPLLHFFLDRYREAYRNQITAFVDVVENEDCATVEFQNVQAEDAYCIEGWIVDANGDYGLPGWVVEVTPVDKNGYELENGDTFTTTAPNGMYTVDFVDADGNAVDDYRLSGGGNDLVLTGAQADAGAGEVGGMLAAMLDWPYASLVNKIDVADGKLVVGREIEGGNQEMNEIGMPCVVSIQTGINEPRYVGIRGIRKVASVEIPSMGMGDLGVDAAAVDAKVKRVDYFVPELGDGAEMLEGSTDEIIDKLIEMLKAKGGLK